MERQVVCVSNVHLHTRADEVHRSVENTICPWGAPSKVVSCTHSARIVNGGVVKGFDVFQHKTKHYFSPHMHHARTPHTHTLSRTRTSHPLTLTCGLDTFHFAVSIVFITGNDVPFKTRAADFPFTQQTDCFVLKWLDKK